MSDCDNAQVLLYKVEERLAGIVPRLNTILGRNQNDPPLGEADGSFTVNKWIALRESVWHLKQFEQCFSHFLADTESTEHSISTTTDTTESF